MAIEDDLVEWLNSIITATTKFKNSITTVSDPVVLKDISPKMEEIKAHIEKVTNPETSTNSKLEFDELKEILNSQTWPECVNQNLICDVNSETDKKERARGIIELMVEENIQSLKFLDYGCGEGHCAALSTEYETAMSVGFDISKASNWDNFEQKPNLKFTNTYSEVEKHGPYDVIILFDVIDHLEGEDPVSVLKKVKQLLAPNGVIYMRCHPYTSRHATHLYHELNKAYVHLVFTDEELKLLLPDAKYTEKNLGVTYPIVTYNGYIEKAGLKNLNLRQIKENPEEFFKTPKIADRIKKNTGFDSFPEFQLSVQFLDYKLGN